MKFDFGSYNRSKSYINKGNSRSQELGKTHNLLNYLFRLKIGAGSYEDIDNKFKFAWRYAYQPNRRVEKLEGVSKFQKENDVGHTNYWIYRLKLRHKALDIVKFCIEHGWRYVLTRNSLVRSGNLSHNNLSGCYKAGLYVGRYQFISHGMTNRYDIYHCKWIQIHNIAFNGEVSKEFCNVSCSLYASHISTRVALCV